MTTPKDMSPSNTLNPSQVLFLTTWSQQTIKCKRKTRPYQLTKRVHKLRTELTAARNEVNVIVQKHAKRSADSYANVEKRGEQTMKNVEEALTKYIEEVKPQLSVPTVDKIMIEEEQ
jgi:ElaB/YqjD/DUF883 family membrane-anchored ribosome-binding protein